MYTKYVISLILLIFCVSENVKNLAKATSVFDDYSGTRSEKQHFQKSARAKASILPVTKDAVDRELRNVSPFPLSLTKSTSKGKLRGMLVGASLNRTVSAYLGIPYAKPPIRDLRFRTPKDISSWSGTRDATRQPASCYQREDLFFADFEGLKEQQPRILPDEDCLYLNVFVPNEHKESRSDDLRNINEVRDTKLSVIIYIHGGGFHSGSSLPKRGSKNGIRQSEWTPDPRELASEGNVIIVTIQYRLSSFGFLFLDDEFAPGNVGLLDQYMALEWVRNEISSFGGDPKSITVMGQEAGGVSALIHYTQNPALFQRMILHSSGKQHVM